MAGMPGLVAIGSEQGEVSANVNEGEALFSQDKPQLFRFYATIKEKCPKIDITKDNLGEHDYKERPEWTKGTTSGSIERIENENFIYIGEVRKGDPTIIEGLGKKFMIKK